MDEERAMAALGGRGERTAATLGVLACVLTVGAVAAPYLLLPPELGDTVTPYYGTGLVTPLAPGLLAIVGAIVFASGRERRSDPDLVAGVMLVVALFSLAVSLQWALSFRVDLVDSTEALEFMSTHRWSVPAAALLQTIAAVWYAAARRLIPVPGGS